jgi:hypothetical protein
LSVGCWTFNALSGDVTMMHAAARAAAPVAQSRESETIYVVRADAQLADLPGAVVKIVACFDGQRTLAEVCAVAQISVSKGGAVVRKLSALGVLDVAGTSKNRTSVSQLESSDTLRGLPALRTPGFSEDEEAFFSSDVPPIDECDLPFESLGEKVSHFVSDLVLRLKGSPAL